MSSQTLSRGARFAALLLAAFLSPSCAEPPESPPVTTAPAALVPTPEVWLQAIAFQIPAGAFDNPAAITMWGYARCAANFADCGTATVPGPRIVALEGQALTIHLRNALATAYAEPTSLIIPGQLQAMTPVWIDPATQAVTAMGARPPGDVTSRVRSFTTETPADGVTQVTYRWDQPKAGTYLYQSGTHPALQVQMGLYGALTVYPPPGTSAYADPSTAFDSEAVLLFSEIDPALHDAVASGQYGPNPAPPDGWLTSTIGYRSRYFLLNGRPWSASAPPVGGAAIGARLLLRFLNAGLETKVPLVQGPHLSVIAEDGNFIAVTAPTGAVVPAPREQYDVFLPAGKTVDALFVAPARGDVAVYDRRLNLTNAGASPGGQLGYLSIGAPGQPVLTVAPQAVVVLTRVGTVTSRQVTVQNSGLAARTLSSVRLAPLGTSPVSPSWSVSLPAPVTLAAGQQARVTVTYAPAAGELSTARIEFTTNDPQAPTVGTTLLGLAF